MWFVLTMAGHFDLYWPQFVLMFVITFPYDALSGVCIQCLWSFVPGTWPYFTSHRWNRVNPLSALIFHEILLMIKENNFESLDEISSYIENISVVLSTVPADGLASSGARPSAGTVVKKFGSTLYTGPALDGHLSHAYYEYMHQWTDHVWHE